MINETARDALRQVVSILLEQQRKCLDEGCPYCKGRILHPETIGGNEPRPRAA